MFRSIVASIVLIGCCAAIALCAYARVILPSGWRLTPPQGAVAVTGTMPQGLALSPDSTHIAVVESGVLPAMLRIYDTSLHQTQAVALPNAFGAPVWLDGTHVLVAGASTDAVLDVDDQSQAIQKIPASKDAWPASVALSSDRKSMAIANDGDGTVAIGTPSSLDNEHAIHVGDHPAAVAFSADGATLYASVRQTSEVVCIDVATRRVTSRIPVGRHPGALLLSPDGDKLYVAESDDDSVGVINTRTNARVNGIPVGLHDARVTGFGASPNALAQNANDVFVSLGAENAIAIISGGRVATRIPAGWYPTGVAVDSAGTLFVSNGKGESAPANPQFNPTVPNSPGYVAAITVGSVRAIPAPSYASAPNGTAQVVENARPLWTPAPASRTVLRANGPIKHVIYVIKENRSYDEVLGDLGQGDGDSHLVWFGKTITPNQHLLASRFGIFDNAYANSQVSADGHNWTDAGFANDYVERYWPVNYGGRRDLYDFQQGTSSDVPHNGYLWDAAKRAHLTYRDYGEDVDRAPHTPGVVILNTFPGLAGHFDPRYVGWDLSYSDDDRYAEWLREFNNFVSKRDLPQFEIVYLPNDHTAGTHPGAPTPQAYVADNDWAVGRLVDTVSRSPYWKSTAIFVVEDDAQNGPDHVSDQRSTFYIASPYARGSVQHAHYSTVSVLHTIELILGMPPLSIYDATAQPFYAAFALQPANAKPFASVKPSVDMNARNTKAAYGAALSARMNFSQPDAADSRELNDILEHAAQ